MIFTELMPRNLLYTPYRVMLAGTLSTTVRCSSPIFDPITRSSAYNKSIDLFFFLLHLVVWFTYTTVALYASLLCVISFVRLLPAWKFTLRPGIAGGVKLYRHFLFCSVIVSIWRWIRWAQASSFSVLHLAQLHCCLSCFKSGTSWGRSHVIK